MVGGVQGCSCSCMYVSPGGCYRLRYAKQPVIQRPSLGQLDRGGYKGNSTGSAPDSWFLIQQLQVLFLQAKECDIHSFCE